MKKRDRENINPTPEAVVAMSLYCDGYAAQRGGSMDFWEALPESKQRRCIELLEDIRRAERAHKAR